MIIEHWNIIKIINSLGDTENQPSTFRARNWVEKNDESQRTYSAGSNIRFSQRSNLRDY